MLENALAQVQSLLALNLDPSGDGLEEWLARFRSLTGDIALRETLVIRLLQMKLPRIAEVLALVGAITLTWDDAAPPPARLRHRLDGTGGVREPARQTGDGYAIQPRSRGVPDLKALQVLLLLLIAGPTSSWASSTPVAWASSPLPAGDGVDLTDPTDLVNSPIAVPLADRSRTGAPRPSRGSRTSPRSLPGSATDRARRARRGGRPDAPPSNGLTASIVADASAVRAAKIPLWKDPGWVLTGEARPQQVPVTARMRIAGKRSRSERRRAVSQTRSCGSSSALAHAPGNGRRPPLRGQGRHALRDPRCQGRRHPSRRSSSASPPFGYILCLSTLCASASAPTCWLPWRWGCPCRGRFIFDPLGGGPVVPSGRLVCRAAHRAAA